MIHYLGRPQNRLGNLPKVANGKLKEGILGNFQTIKLMSMLAHKQKGLQIVRRLAEEIIYDAQIPSHYFLDEAKAIGRFVRDNVRYLKDPVNIEMLQDPVTMIERSQYGKATGDCDDQATLAAALMLSIGIEPYFKIIRYHGHNSGYQHIYLQVNARNNNGPMRQLIIDPIMKEKQIGYENPHIKSKLFLV